MKRNNILRLLKLLPQYWLMKNIGWPKVLPTNLTLNVTYNCNSRCSTCNIWLKKVKELSLSEWKKIFIKYNGHPFWLILSGGEPFLRKDFIELVFAAYEILQPAVINIPTNGILCGVIPEKVEAILKKCLNSEIIINFSLDAIGKEHDQIRNVPGNFEKLIFSYQKVRMLKELYPNLTVGLHTVVSKFNVKKIPEICDFALSLNPDQYIAEIAEERAELGTIGSKINPELKDYEQAIDYVSKKISEKSFVGPVRITQILRKEYYEFTKEILRQKFQLFPCFAGWASAQISAEGWIWACCIKCQNFGDLRDNEYDFQKVWFGPKAINIREKIKNRGCFCTLASASYTNMVLSPRKLFKIAWQYLVNKNY